jgi:hypothetical protein
VAKAYREHPGGVFAQRLGEHVQRLAELGEGLLDDRPEDRVLGVEVVVKATLRDVCRIGDVLDGGRVHPLGGEDLPSGSHQGGPGSETSALSAVLGVRSSHEQRYISK